MGFISATGYYLFQFFVKVQCFDHNPRKRGLRWKTVFDLVIVAEIMGLVRCGMLPIKNEINNNILAIYGIYGRGILLNEIYSFWLTDTLPETIFRLNGLSFGSTKKVGLKKRRTMFAISFFRFWISYIDQ